MHWTQESRKTQETKQGDEMDNNKTNWEKKMNNISLFLFSLKICVMCVCGVWTILIRIHTHTPHTHWWLADGRWPLHKYRIRKVSSYLFWIRSARFDSTHLLDSARIGFGSTRLDYSIWRARIESVSELIGRTQLKSFQHKKSLNQIKYRLIWTIRQYSRVETEPETETEAERMV